MDKIFILPVVDKPIKIIFEELPCPIDSSIRCKHAKSSIDDYLIYKIKCSTFKDCKRFQLAEK